MVRSSTGKSSISGIYIYIYIYIYISYILLLHCTEIIWNSADLNYKVAV